MEIFISTIERLTISGLYSPKWKNKTTIIVAPTVSIQATEDRSALHNKEKTSLLSATSKYKLKQPSTDDQHDKNYAPPKQPTWHSVESEIEEIHLDQYRNEIFDSPEVCVHFFLFLVH